MELKLNFGTIRMENFEKYREMDKDFKEVIILNAPEDFISISNEDSYKRGYLIDMTKLKDKTAFGQEEIDGNTVTFDIDDVIVYDKNGTVYYAKGYQYDGYVFYNATEKRPQSTVTQ